MEQTFLVISENILILRCLQIYWLICLNLSCTEIQYFNIINWSVFCFVYILTAEYSLPIEFPIKNPPEAELGKMLQGWWQMSAICLNQPLFLKNIVDRPYCRHSSIKTTSHFFLFDQNMPRCDWEFFFLSFRWSYCKWNIILIMLKKKTLF